MFYKNNDTNLQSSQTNQEENTHLLIFSGDILSSDILSWYQDMQTLQCRTGGNLVIVVAWT